MFDLLDFSTLEAAGRIAWRASWQASALALAVFAVLACARHRISAAWRYGLWSLVLARLLLPWAPPTQWSPFNLAENRPQPTQPVVVARPDASRRDLSIAPMIPPPARPPVRTASAMPSNNQPARPDLQSVLSALAPLAVFAWLLGVLTMLGGTTWQLARLRRAMKGWRDVDDRGVLELADECRARLGLRRRVRLRVAPDETGPAIYGIIRPRVVLPESLLTEFSRGQLEAILLHEMAHVRRHDPAVHWLMIAARVLHWFNPIAWFAVSRMAAERELACDDAVIEVLGRSSRQLYGETILRLVGRLVEGPAAPGLVHFFGSKRRLWRRLDSLTRAKAMGRRARWVALALLVGLAAFGLTDAVHTVAAGRDQTPPQPSPKANAAPAPKKEPMTWPLDAELTGKVVDDKGEPVADAVVVPLGPEKLILDPIPNPDKTDLRLSWSVTPGRAKDAPPRKPGDPPVQELANPASTKTDKAGHFSIRRSGTPANRIAVISQKVLLWVASREQLGDSKDLTIKLPEPGSLTIHCDIPDKPKKLDFWLKLRTFDGVDWDPDIIYLSQTAANPGKKLVQGLPPAQFAVERANITPTGDNRDLMTFCERQLVSIKPGQRANLTYNRQVGRRVIGIVRGLGFNDLQYAHVSVMYFGPEEMFMGPDGRSRPGRVGTGFDVIPVGPDHRFAIQKLPAGHYMLSFFALRSDTPRTNHQQSDYQGGVEIDIPETGEIPPVKIDAQPRVSGPPSQEPDPNSAKSASDTEFFGARTKGRSVAYVIDCSGSMALRNTLDVAKRELIAGIDRLPSYAKFMVICYSDTVKVLTDAAGHEGLMPATAANKAGVRAQIAKIPPFGKSDHSKAIEAALKPKPDVVSLMTDADMLSDRDVDAILKNAGKTRILAVDFGRGSDPGHETPLRRLARKSRGAYNFVNVKELSRKAAAH
jgi:beta-lactamase regulating signal transducer with metallopeptidase domain